MGQAGSKPGLQFRKPAAPAPPAAAPHNVPHPTLKAGERISHPADKAPYNYGPASTRDDIVYTIQRPGMDESLNVPGGIPSTLVDEWIAFAKENNVKRVLTLLDDNELEYYQEPLFQQYERAGLKYNHVPMGGPNAKAEVEAALREAEAAGERVVAHCTHGMGRSGRVAAAWLVIRYGLNPEDATNEVMATAEAKQLERMGASNKLRKWMGMTPLEAS